MLNKSLMEPSIESFCVLPNMLAFTAYTSSCGALREGCDAINTHNSCLTWKNNFNQLNYEKLHQRRHRW